MSNQSRDLSDIKLLEVERINQGLSNAELARRCGKTKQTIYRFLNRERKHACHSPELLTKIRQVLNVSL